MKTLLYQTQVTIKEHYEKQLPNIIVEVNKERLTPIEYVGMGVQFAINIVHNIEALSRQQLKGADKDFIDKVDKWAIEKPQLMGELKRAANKINELNLKIKEYETREQEVRILKENSDKSKGNNQSSWNKVCNRIQNTRFYTLCKSIVNRNNHK